VGATAPNNESASANKPASRRCQSSLQHSPSFHQYVRKSLLEVIASISGHASLREVERYTKAADQARMARVGMDAITMGTSGYKLEDQFVKKGEKA
jgi:hypothetical protein